MKQRRLDDSKMASEQLEELKKRIAKCDEDVD
jgi:hypothetical protein